MKKEHIFKNRIEYKECSACKKLLELNNFSKNKSSRDGLKPYCKKCASEKGKIYRSSMRKLDSMVAHPREGARYRVFSSKDTV